VRKRSSCVPAEVWFEHLESAGMRKSADVVNVLVDNDPGIAGTIVAGNGFEGYRIGHGRPPKRVHGFLIRKIEGVKKSIVLDLNEIAKENHRWPHKERKQNDYQ
jgi:hypothetical protein